MAESNKIRFILFVLLMIFPVHALDVLFSRADEDFKQKSEIKMKIINGKKIYCGTLHRLAYRPAPDTSKVIVYIIDRSRFVEIIRNAVRETRLRIARQLRERHCELVFLGIEDFNDDEYILISAFMDDKIQTHRSPSQTNFTIETIGDKHFDHFYHWHVRNFSKYQENAQICGGTLRAHLRSIRHGALRPVESNGKVIKLLGYFPREEEVSWPVNVVNDTYLPQVDVNNPKYNFVIAHRAKKVCLLILSGKEYLALISYIRNRSALEIMETTAGILDEMKSNNEDLVILGVFNFHWTEIDIVTKIILKHSEGCEGYDCKVFTCGYGMFNTVYLNVYVADGRFIFQQPQSYALEMIKVLMREEVEERLIIMCYLDDEWDFLEMPITSANGQYLPAAHLNNYTFPWVNQRIAFIVYDPIETNDSIDFTMVSESVKELKRSGINVVLVNAFNFRSDELHIIAQWVDCHRQLFIKPEQIAILGAGIFDTIFQSKTTTHKTLFNTKKNELKNIRNAFVTKGNEKRVFTAKIDKYPSSDPRSEVWTYPMNTVNGFYEPDLIPDTNMFDPTGTKNILFLITSADRFHKILAMKEVGHETSFFRQEIRRYFAYVAWNVFLVGLDNFDKQDYHLFAELVNVQTKYERCMEQFMCTFNYGIGPPLYQYNDNPPFPIITNPKLEFHIASFFERTCCRSDGTSSSHYR